MTTALNLAGLLHRAVAHDAANQPQTTWGKQHVKPVADAV